MCNNTMCYIFSAFQIKECVGKTIKTCYVALAGFFLLSAGSVCVHPLCSELVVCGETDILAANIRININRMKEYATEEAITGFQKQFQVTMECVLYYI